MSKELTYLQKLEKDYLRIEAENETLSSALHDARHEVRVLKNKAENLERDFMYYFKLANKSDHQNKRYQKILEKVRQYMIGHYELGGERDTYVRWSKELIDKELEGEE